MSEAEVAVSGVWLRTIGDRVQLLVEVEGRWLLVNDERLYDGERTIISHITEVSGILGSPEDPIDGKAA